MGKIKLCDWLGKKGNTVGKNDMAILNHRNLRLCVHPKITQEDFVLPCTGKDPTPMLCPLRELKPFDEISVGVIDVNGEGQMFTALNQDLMIRDTARVIRQNAKQIQAANSGMRTSNFRREIFLNTVKFSYDVEINGERKTETIDMNVYSIVIVALVQWLKDQVPDVDRLLDYDRMARRFKNEKSGLFS